jgi:sulfur transfer protein SufE
MDEMIEITAEKVFNSLSGFSWSDQAYMLIEIAKKLRNYASECLEVEYGIEETDSN